ncbi:hypothetical protein SARC_10852 [Sphaeroforma arctica JP610]|uniref:Uncharacterized protein n=1 Tax=Sphaeroforma arctica JP610 TaxID=667725 RepID=A0A0L0FIQ3_9EUKA|nr:hypothetical protein SARC_10852 [Sphaeroforma arctica JP610]KNC76657.1 hypothetical protein SARC_10852 [Sphaeroforma arctica JP610]|eukprot:XP_014150559.1 hypothetical protein SARC_10852 [Sphaeroforma arctica JP610]
MSNLNTRAAYEFMSASDFKTELRSFCDEFLTELSIVESPADAENFINGYKAKVKETQLKLKNAIETVSLFFRNDEQAALDSMVNLAKCDWQQRFPASQQHTFFDRLFKLQWWNFLANCSNDKHFIPMDWNRVGMTEVYTNDTAAMQAINDSNQPGASCCILIPELRSLPHNKIESKAIVVVQPDKVEIFNKNTRGSAAIAGDVRATARACDGKDNTIMHERNDNQCIRQPHGAQDTGSSESDSVNNVRRHNSNIVRPPKFIYPRSTYTVPRISIPSSPQQRSAPQNVYKPSSFLNYDKDGPDRSFKNPEFQMATANGWKHSSNNNDRQNKHHGMGKSANDERATNQNNRNQMEKQEGMDSGDDSVMVVDEL